MTAANDGAAAAPARPKPQPPRFRPQPRPEHDPAFDEEQQDPSN